MGEPEQADNRNIVSLMSDVIYQVNRPPIQGALKVFLLAGLLICHGI